MLLATNLGGIFSGGKNIQEQQLCRLLRANLNVRLVFVADSGLDSVIPVVNDAVIPTPDYIICDVGATIVNGHTLEPVHPLQSEIDRKWPGHSRIADALKNIEGIFYHDEPRQRRCSYIMKDDLPLAAVRASLAGFNCEIAYAAQFLHVLPAGVSKGSSLQQLVSFLGVKQNDVLVAGSALNDLTLYQYGFKGVVVGNAEQKLVEATQKLDNIYYATAPGAGGILEAITYFPGLAKSINIPEQHNVSEAVVDT